MCLPIRSLGSSLLRAWEVELVVRNWLLAVSKKESEKAEPGGSQPHACRALLQSC